MNCDEYRQVFDSLREHDVAKVCVENSPIITQDGPNKMVYRLKIIDTGTSLDRKGIWYVTAESIFGFRVELDQWRGMRVLGDAKSKGFVAEIENLGGDEALFKFHAARRDLDGYLLQSQ